MKKPIGYVRNQFYLLKNDLDDLCRDKSIDADDPVMRIFPDIESTLHSFIKPTQDPWAVYQVLEDSKGNRRYKPVRKIIRGGSLFFPADSRRLTISDRAIRRAFCMGEWAMRKCFGDPPNVDIYIKHD